MNTCRTCMYWEKLGPGSLSWGTCDWFKSNRVPVPMWVAIVTEHGALSPKQAGCKVHTEKSKAKTPGPVRSRSKEVIVAKKQPAKPGKMPMPMKKGKGKC